jgi:hypothetical protein
MANKEFQISREVELPAGAEEVWQAVTTGEGNAAWMFPNDIDPSIVQDSDRPRHFAVRTEGPGGWFNALEFTLEPRGDGTLLRYVHSGVFDDAAWDDQYDAVNNHTDFYLHTLGQYLEHFSGRPVTYVGPPPAGVQGPEASSQPGSFARVREALGASAVGDSVRVEFDGAGTIDGVVDYLEPQFAGIRTDDALYRFFGREPWGGRVGASAHLFTAGADAATTERGLQSWLDGVFA